MRTSENTYSTTFVNKGKRKGQDNAPGPAHMGRHVLVA